jgi:hypothetical protein
MKLVLCPSRTFAVYLLAYIQEFGEGKKFHMIVSGVREVPAELLNLGSKVNTEFVSQEQIEGVAYEELIMHSYALWHKQSEFISGIDFNSMSFYSDGLRNGFYGLPSLNNKLEKLIHFGFMLREKSFELLTQNGKEDLQRQVVSWHQLKKTWLQLLGTSNKTSHSNFMEDDLVVTMRHWSMESLPFYRFKELNSVHDYLKSELTNLGGIKRVIFRSHPWFDDQFSHSDLVEVFGSDVEIVTWENVFTPNLDFPELTQPEAVFWQTNQGPGFFFGFDSSLVLLVSQEFKETEILWPDRRNYAPYFHTKASVELVDEQIQWMRQIAKLNLNINSKVAEVDVDGFPMASLVTTMMLENWDSALTQEHDALTQERDALTQERDALTQERDALTQERDALTQERDALRNSTIWRLMGPLRKILNIVKS